MDGPAATTVDDLEPGPARLVAAGANLLDDAGPADWPTRVDIYRLNLDSCRRCVLGQVFATPDDGDNVDTFWRGVMELGIDEPSNYGFDAGTLAERADLESQWRRLIIERHNAIVDGSEAATS